MSPEAHSRTFQNIPEPYGIFKYLKNFQEPSLNAVEKAASCANLNKKKRPQHFNLIE